MSLYFQPLDQHQCPECAALAVGGHTCWEQLGYLLAWEVDDPELASYHFLTVASYNLQHPAQFTDDAVTLLRTALIDYLDRDLAPNEIRRRMATHFAGAEPVLRREIDRTPVLRRWRMTIVDVYANGDCRGAAVRVHHWATSIRDEIIADDARPY